MRRVGISILINRCEWGGCLYKLSAAVLKYVSKYRCIVVVCVLGCGYAVLSIHDVWCVNCVYLWWLFLRVVDM